MRFVQVVPSSLHEFVCSSFVPFEIVTVWIVSLSRFNDERIVISIRSKDSRLTINELRFVSNIDVPNYLLVRT